MDSRNKSTWPDTSDRSPANKVLHQSTAIPVKISRDKACRAQLVDEGISMKHCLRSHVSVYRVSQRDHGWEGGFTKSVFGLKPHTVFCSKGHEMLALGGVVLKVHPKNPSQRLPTLAKASLP